MHVLFVCTGNICRSPTAERLATSYSVQGGLHDCSFSSAGTHAVAGHPIHRSAALVLSEFGGDASHFAARQLTPSIAADPDLVLTMTKAHRDYVLNLAPQKLHRTFTLREAAQIVSTCDVRNIDGLAEFRAQLATEGSLDIADPIGRPEAIFKVVGKQIADCLPPLLKLCNG